MNQPALHSLFSRLSNRKWACIATVALVAIGMTYTLYWEPVVRHHAYWIVAGDIWGTFRSAHYIGWGDFGGVYAAGTSLITFPGILLVLAPVAMLSGVLGLTEGFPYFLTHPTAWYVLGPVEMLVSCTVLFACDALAQRLGASSGRRALVAVAGAAALWNVVIIWGHPEDALAIAFAVYALVFGLDGRWTGAGWLFGAAVATQPVVVLMLPVLVAMAGKRHAPGLLLRSVLLAAVLLVTPLVAEFHVTAHALLDQPNFPNIDHATPWTALAPRLSGSGRSLAVAAGPGRVVALLLACGLGWWARRWRYRPELLMWAVCVALALRCFTESVMDPYYVWPPLALGLVVAGAKADLWRLVPVAVVVAFMTAVSNWHLEMWMWWGVMTAGIVLVMALSAPPRVLRAGTRLELKVDDQPADVSHGTLVAAFRS